MNNDLISRKELRKAFKKSPVFTEAILYYARQLIDDAPTVELDEDDIQSLLNKRCMTVVTNEHLRSLYDSLTPCYQTTSCLDCKMYDKKNHRCPRFCEVIRDLVKEAESIKPEDHRRSFTKALCGDCKYADVPRNRKPCCSCSWLERECYYEEAEND